MEGQTFSDWYKEHEAVFAMENQILLDKLRQGVNGIEWLVHQVNVDSYTQDSIDQWLKCLQVCGYDPFPVMRDALLMGEDEFYLKYKLNWWIGVGDTLSILRLLREKEYETYFKFLQDLR